MPVTLTEEMLVSASGCEEMSLLAMVPHNHIEQGQGYQLSVGDISRKGEARD
jgi:hypothetical protein